MGLATGMRAGALVLALWAAAAPAASVKKWVDAEGNVHFGDAPPPEASAKDVETASGAAAGEPEARPGLRPGERAMLRGIESEERAFLEARDRSAAQLERRAQQGADAAAHDEDRAMNCAYYSARFDEAEHERRQGYGSESDKHRQRSAVAHYERTVFEELVGSRLNLVLARSERRELGDVEQTLMRLGARRTVTFSPHLVPMSRGIGPPRRVGLCGVRSRRRTVGPRVAMEPPSERTAADNRGRP